jgi:hypothetical protein
MDDMGIKHLVKFIQAVADNGGYRERAELINAYNGGLDWFTNFSVDVQNAMYYLVEASEEQGFTKLPAIGE